MAEFGLSPRSSETAQGKQFWILAPAVREDASRETKTVLSASLTGHLRELPEAKGRGEMDPIFDNAADFEAVQQLLVTGEDLEVVIGDFSKPADPSTGSMDQEQVGVAVTSRRLIFRIRYIVERRKEIEADVSEYVSILYDRIIRVVLHEGYHKKNGLSLYVTVLVPSDHMPSTVELKYIALPNHDIIRTVHKLIISHMI